MTEEKNIPVENRIRIKTPDYTHIPEADFKRFSNSEKVWGTVAITLLFICLIQFIRFSLN